jgi:hypothetical protein
MATKYWHGILLYTYADYCNLAGGDMVFWLIGGYPGGDMVFWLIGAYEPITKYTF